MFGKPVVALFILCLIINWATGSINGSMESWRTGCSFGEEDCGRRRGGCVCEGGECACCTGLVFDYVGVDLQNRLCVNITYEPDEFELHYKLLFNERTLYQSKMSGKNPRPVCLPLITQFTSLKLCMKFSNIYMLGRNVHACLDLTGDWRNIPLYKVSFDCFRLGTSGIAMVKPEEGGGLPVNLAQEQGTEDLDYDDSAKSGSVLKKNA